MSRNPAFSLVRAALLVLFGIALADLGAGQTLKSSETHTVIDATPGVMPNQREPRSESAATPTNQIERAKGLSGTRSRQNIFNKLDRIRFDSISFDNLPLAEVVRFLGDRTRRLDPEHRGVNFVILPSRNYEPVVQAPASQATPNVTTASPAASGGEPLDVNAIPINLAAPLDDIRLVDLLEVLTKIAPIRYSVEDYAVVFRLKTTESDFLFVRSYKIDPNTFMEGMENVVGFPFGNLGAGGAGGGQGAQGGGILTVPRVSVAPTVGATGVGPGAVGAGGITGVTRPTLKTGASTAVVGYFNNLGVDLSPPKSVFFNDREGTLVVRATTQDLDTISAALEQIRPPNPPTAAASPNR